MDFITNSFRNAVVTAALSLFCLFGVVPLVYAAGSLPAGLTTSMEVSTGVVGSPTEMSVEVVVTNETAATVSFSRRGTILDIGMEHNYFDVLYGGSAMQFWPIHMKRPAESEIDQIVLSPGQSVGNTIPISPYYGITTQGQYSISLKSTNISKSSKATSQQSIQVLSDLDQNPYSSQKRTFAHRSCNTTEVNVLNDAIDQANVLARTASLDLRNTAANLRSSAPRFREWFGAFSAGRYDQVQRNFDAIDDAITNQQISTDCGCSAIPPSERGNLFAFVFPNQPFVVNLCDAFWPAPLTGTDSQAGVIVHEVSHFTVVSETIDNAVGVTASRNLARSNPSAAILNADNHEYFAENNPRLRMGPSDVTSCRINPTNTVSPITQPVAPPAPTFAGNALSQAVDDLQRDYVTQAPQFFRVTERSTRGGDSARSGRVGDGGASIMAVAATGPGSVTFDWSVSSEAGFDFLGFVIFDVFGNDTGITGDISGERGFASRSFSIPAGLHTLFWIYIKDGSVSRGLDAGFVDNVRITEPGVSPFVSSNRAVTEIDCGNTVIAPIINLLLDDEQ